MRASRPGVLVALVACGSKPAVDDCPEPGTWFVDADADGWGSAQTVQSCAPVAGAVAAPGDCDDGAPASHPGAAEICDPLDTDEDCDGLADDADPDVTGILPWYADADGDDHGAGEATAPACDGGAGYAAVGDDCDDADPLTFPGAPERCDGVDSDCDERTGEGGLATWTDAVGSADWTAILGGTEAEPVDIDIDVDGTLAVCAGTWYAHLRLAANVRVHSPAATGAVVFSGGGTGTVVAVAGDGWDVELSGLTLRDGLGSADVFGDGRGAGGAIACDGASGVTGEDLVIEENRAELGGGVASAGCQVYLRGGILRGNEAEEGGALRAEGGHLELNRLDVVDNAATVEGGAIAVDTGRVDSFLVLGDALVEGNAAPVAGAVSLRGDVALHCYGTNRERAGILANSSDAGAVLTTDGSSAVEFIRCDLGEPATADDNRPTDVHTESGDFALGDDILGWCWSDGCDLLEK
jgi:hypothetical protein